MRRHALIWIAIGAALASVSWIGVGILSQPEKEFGLVINDDFPEAFFEKARSEKGRFLERSAHRCRASEYSVELPPPDGFGTLSVPIVSNSKASINCLLATAKEWQLSIEIAEMKRPTVERIEKK